MRRLVSGSPPWRASATAAPAWRTSAAESGHSETTKGELENDVAELREARGAATDAARENLIAVENQIRELNEALGAIGPGVACWKPILRFWRSQQRLLNASRPTAEAPPRRRSRRSPRWPPRTRALNRAARMTICSG